MVKFFEASGEEEEEELPSAGSMKNSTPSSWERLKAEEAQEQKDLEVLRVRKLAEEAERKRYAEAEEEEELPNVVVFTPVEEASVEADSDGVDSESVSASFEEAPPPAVEAEQSDSFVASFDDEEDDAAALIRKMNSSSSDDEEDEEDEYESTKRELDELTETLNAKKRLTSYLGDEAEEDYEELDIDEVLSSAIDAGASDVYIKAEEQIAFKIKGDIAFQPQFMAVSGDKIKEVQREIVSHVMDDSFIHNLELDASYTIRSGRHAGRRSRLNVGRSLGNIFMVFRVISDVIPLPHELDISQEIQDWMNFGSGLILLNGPTGQGKSTTLASLLNQYYIHRERTILTIERPVEFLYSAPSHKGFMVQREVGNDSRDFAKPLTSGMRQAPDVILVGEVRQREEIDTLIRAAESGHLALSTLHSENVPTTLNRIRSVFPGDEQPRILSTFSEMVKGLANQMLVKNDKNERYAVRETLTVDDESRKLIAAGDSHGLREMMIRRGITMEHELLKAVKDGRATPESALSKTSRYDFLKEMLVRDGLLKD